MGIFMSMPNPYVGEKVVATAAALSFDNTGSLPFSGTGFITYNPALVKGGKVGCSVLNPKGRLDFAAYSDVGTVTCAPVTKDGSIRIDVNVKAGTTPNPNDQFDFPVFLSFTPKTAGSVEFTFPWQDSTGNNFGTTTQTDDIFVNPSRTISSKLCKSPDGTVVKGFNITDTDCTFSTAKRGGAAQGRTLMSLPKKTVRTFVPPEFLPPIAGDRPVAQAYAKEYFTTQPFQVTVADTSAAATPLTRHTLTFTLANANDVLAGKVYCDVSFEASNQAGWNPRNVRCDVDAKTKTATVTLIDPTSKGGFVLMSLGLKAKSSGQLSIDAPTNVLADGTVQRATVPFQVAPPRSTCDRVCKANNGQSDATCICCTFGSQGSTTSKTCGTYAA